MEAIVDILYTRQSAKTDVQSAKTDSQSAKTEVQSTKTDVHDEDCWFNAGVRAVCSVMMNYVETSRHIIFNKHHRKEKTYKIFESKLRDISKTNLSFYYTGSQMQNMTAIYWRYPTDSTSMGRQCDSDVDVLMVDSSTCAVEAKDCCTSHNYIYVNSQNHPGYVRLYKGRGKGKKIISGKGFKKFWNRIIDQQEIRTRLHGRGNQFPGRGEKRSGPAFTKMENVGRRDFVCHDFVPAIKLIKWPSIARNWKSRPRPGGWPSANQLQECVRSDCHIVPVPHKESSPYIKRKEWRISFSGAEIVLLQSLTFQQRQAAIVSKLILKLVLQDVLKRKPSLKNSKAVSSYELKTSFLWLCESKTNWGNLTIDIKDILDNLVQNLQKGNLPDYFIPEKNIIENISQEIVHQVSLIIAQVVTKQGLVHILQKCFAYCYSSELETCIDSLDGTTSKCLYKEIQDFCDRGMPSVKLLMFTLIHLLLSLFEVSIDGTVGDVWVFDTKPLLFDIGCIQNELNKTLNLKTEIIDLQKLESILNENEPFSQELLSAFTDLVFEVLSKDVVADALDISIWCVVARLLSRHCITAGLRYGFKQEVLEFASLLEADKENTQLAEIAIDRFGSLELFQSTVAQYSEEINSLYKIYESICQYSLLLYFNTCTRYSVEQEFYCRDENIAFEGIKSIVREIPEILEDEMLGTPELRQRLKSLLETNLSVQIVHF